MSFLFSGLLNVLSGLLLVAEITSAVYPRHHKLSAYSRASDFTYPTSNIPSHTLRRRDSSGLQLTGIFCHDLTTVSTIQINSSPATAKPLSISIFKQAITHLPLLVVSSIFILVASGCSTVQEEKFSPVPQELLVPSEWQVEDVDERGLPDNANVTLRFQEDGRLTGSTGCNRLTGSHIYQGRQLTISQVATTRRACVPALMDLERRFVDALAASAMIELSPANQLTLLDSTGAIRLRLVAKFNKQMQHSSQTSSETYTCADGTTFAIAFQATNVLTMALDDERHQLNQVISASGSHYKSPGLNLWLKGNEARLETGDTTQVCRS